MASRRTPLPSWMEAEPGSRDCPPPAAGGRTTPVRTVAVDRQTENPPPVRDGRGINVTSSAGAHLAVYWPRATRLKSLLLLMRVWLTMVRKLGLEVL